MMQTKEPKGRSGVPAALYLFGLTLALLSVLSCGQKSAPLEPTSVVEQALPVASNQTEPPVNSAKDAPAPGSAIPSMAWTSLDDLVYGSDLIARVRLFDVELVYRQDGDLYYAELEYEFTVLDYLKGGRGTERIHGIVSLPYAATIGPTGTSPEIAEKEVQAIATEYMQGRGTRWDDEEAIIFMHDSALGVPSTHEEDIYFLGWFLGLEDELVRARRWLPLVPESQRSDSEEQFILDHPDVESQRRVQQAAMRRHGPTPEPSLSKDALILDGPLISLSQLTDLIAEDESGRLQIRLEAAALADWLWRTESQNLSASTTLNSITLSWNEARYPSEVIGYHVFRREDEESEFVLLAELQADAAEMTYRDTGGITPNSSYTYRVLSKSPKYGGGTADGGSAEIMVETPGAP